ncbi:hypothetical protein AT15_04755 [Kosmotoga arenicorallina S304]|uniref:Release factor glutamine methyltransferase n=1 Tax=Kosmotoga arenicorallina S304 TaxID=1453497 RepID=A0A176JWE4_9BACT|nr:peptide chain release factor N(5)-glutamine methyltransferase [Kosmotoga arenicorallina]OAA28000.1 hypothetical protein AT15_04755 [Kosmotoga arenicorallina S304]
MKVNPQELLRDFEQKLKAAGKNFPRYVLIQLFRDYLSISESLLFFNGYVEIPDSVTRKLENAYERLLKDEPLDYIIGWKKFMNLNLKVDKRALIPRPETEGLVEIVLSECRKNHFFVDIGTGSGAIALSIASGLPDALVYATDISKEALELAMENAATNKIENVKFLQGDCLSPLKPFIDRIEVIVSNPPYIKTEIISGLDISVRKYEPMIALDGGADGIDFYRKFLKELPSGKKVFLEIADYTATALEKLVEEERRDYKIRIEKDLFGLLRYAILNPAL